MRVYLPSTLTLLGAALSAGELTSTTGFAVTPALREWYTEGDLEELEYAASGAAARASLALLAAEDAPPRRVVLAVEMPDRDVQPTPDLGRAAVRLRSSPAGSMPLSLVVSAHVDDGSAQDDVRRAMSALAAADAGDEDAVLAVEGAADHELGWYAAQELPALVALEG